MDKRAAGPIDIAALAARQLNGRFSGIARTASSREERLEGLLRGAKGTIEQLRAVQNGCPLPSYEEAYRLANDEADRTILAINAALEEEGKE